MSRKFVGLLLPFQILFSTVIHLHGRNTSKAHYWYDYLYSETELLPWVNKIKKISEQTESVFVYFNNHSGGKAIERSNSKN